MVNDMDETQKEQYLFNKKEQAKLKYKQAHSETYNTLNFLANAWVFSMIVAFTGIGLLVSGISQSIGILIAVAAGLTSIVCLTLALIGQKGFDYDSKKYVEKQVEFAKAELESNGVQ